MRNSRTCVFSLGIALVAAPLTVHAEGEFAMISTVACDGNIITQSTLTPEGTEVASQSIELLSDTHLIPGLTIHPMPIEMDANQDFLALDDPKKEDDEDEVVIAPAKKKGGDAVGILGAVAGVGLLGGLAGAGGGGGGGGTSISGGGGGGSVGTGNEIGAVPEPATIAALGIGALALLRRKKKS